MEQLSGLDAAFVHQDSRLTPMHITAVLIYDIGDNGEKAIDKNYLRHLVDGTLRQFPVFYRNLLRIPIDVDIPYWIDVLNPDLDCHVTRRVVRAGCGWSEVQRQLALIHRRRLDLSKPLWELCLLDGLDAAGLAAALSGVGYQDSSLGD